MTESDLHFEAYSPCSLKKEGRGMMRSSDPGRLLSWSGTEQAAALDSDGGHAGSVVEVLRHGEAKSWRSLAYVGRLGK